MPTNLSDEQWERVKAVFTAALDREPVERSAFVFDTCGADKLVHHEVERLLVEHERERTFLAHPAIGAGWPATASRARPSQRVRGIILGFIQLAG